jgi:hypothetical protein
MRHFAEFIVFNGFNSLSFRTAAKAAVARADEKPRPRRRRFLKNNTVRQRLWQEIVGFLSRAPARSASRFERIADLAILARLRPTGAQPGRTAARTSFSEPAVRGSKSQGLPLGLWPRSGIGMPKRDNWTHSASAAGVAFAERRLFEPELGCLMIGALTKVVTRSFVVW